MLNLRMEDINTNTDEGKMLLAALSVLTSITANHLHKDGWGETAYVHDVMEKLNNVANYVFFEEEQKRQMMIVNNRESKLNDIGIN